MSFVSWSDQLLIGDSRIDTDHKNLVSYVNELHDAMAQGKGKEVLKSLFGKLLAYTKEHFAREEILWASKNYAGLREHKDQHQQLLKQVLGFNQKFCAGEILLTVSVMTFLRDWLLNHIARSDMAAAKATRIGVATRQSPLSQSV